MLRAWPWLVATVSQHGFVGPDDQSSPQSIRKLLKYVALKVFVKVGQHQVATENQIEGAFRRRLPQILASNLDAAILRFAFEYTENLFMSPDWWDSLTGQSRRWIKEKYLSSIETERTANALVEDHVTLQALTLTDSTSI